MPYTFYQTFASGLVPQTAAALPSNLPRVQSGIQALLIPNTSAAATNCVILTGVQSGGGASGGQVSGAQFTIDPAQQELISGYTIASGGTLAITVYGQGEEPVAP